MDFLAELWMPILVSAVAVFLVSSFFHVVLPFHWNDHAMLPGEDHLLESIRGQQVPPGEYVFPRPGSMKEMGEPAMVEKYTRGPVGFLTIVPSGPPTMGKNLVQWFGYSLLVSVFAAYVAAFTKTESSAMVFRLTSTIAVIGYAFTHIYNSIWKAQNWGTTARFLLDGVIYGLVTGAVFGWMWPGG